MALPQRFSHAIPPLVGDMEEELPPRLLQGSERQHFPTCSPISSAGQGKEEWHPLPMHLPMVLPCQVEFLFTQIRKPQRDWVLGLLTDPEMGHARNSSPADPLENIAHTSHLGVISHCCFMGYLFFCLLTVFPHLATWLQNIFVKGAEDQLLNPLWKDFSL